MRWTFYQESCPSCSSLGLQNQITSPDSWRYISDHEKLFLQSGGHSINLYRCSLLILLLLLVLLSERTLSDIVANLATSKAFDLGNFLLPPAFLLLPLLVPLMVLFTKSRLISYCYRSTHIRSKYDNFSLPRILLTRNFHSSETMFRANCTNSIGSGDDPIADSCSRIS